MTGLSGLSPRSRCAATSSSLIIARQVSSSISSIFMTSCDERKPSKKCMKGTRASSDAALEISAKSWISWIEPEQSMPQPVERAAITSE